MGRCPGCQQWGALLEERAASVAQQPPQPSRPYDSLQSGRAFRIGSLNPEFDRVLGGGIVPGSVILLGGEPGIGKSTLLLQVAENLSHQRQSVLYVSGEESARQIKLRGDRMGIVGASLHLTIETCLEAVLEEVVRSKASVVVIDSIQTVSTQSLSSVPGSIGQIRECAARLVAFAKRHEVSVFLIGHITKDGALAGPKALEHIVDAVLYFEGECHQNQRVVRTVKNRFGASNEVGIFEMTSQGLVGVENASRFFLTQRASHVSGSAVVCALEGSRPVLVEVQALVTQSSDANARRMTSGVDPNRISLLLAVLEKRLGLEILGCDVYVNVVGGLQLTEPAVDLAAVAAIVSSLRNQPLSDDTLLFGEVGLAGEIRAVSQAETRAREAISMGFERVVLPKSNLPLHEEFEGLELLGLESLADGLNALWA